MKPLAISALYIVLITSPISAEVAQLQCKMPYRDTSFLVTIDYGENTLSIDLMNDFTRMIDRLPHSQKMRAIISNDDVSVVIDGTQIIFNKRTRILRDVKKDGESFESESCQNYARKP